MLYIVSYAKSFLSSKWTYVRVEGFFSAIEMAKSLRKQGYVAIIGDEEDIDNEEEVDEA